MFTKCGQFVQKHRPTLNYINDINEIESFGILNRYLSVLSLTKTISPIDLGDAPTINKTPESKIFSIFLPMPGIESDLSSSVVKI